MIKSANKIWDEIGQVNNLAFEFHYLGNDNDIPVLIAEDVFKYPDKVKEFAENLPFWETRRFNDEDTIRPGLTYQFSPLISNSFFDNVSKRVNKLFGVSTSNLKDLYFSCTNGSEMILDTTGGLCCYPHTDSKPYDSDDNSMHIALNINLSKNSYPVKTGFWSWMGKKNLLDFTKDELNSLDDFYDRHEGLDTKTWFQMHDYENFALEDCVEMSYNSLAVYPVTNLHNPYIMPEWFNDCDRLMLTAFYSFFPEDLDFLDGDLDIVSASWEFMRLTTIHNYHPERTKPLL